MQLIVGAEITVDDGTTIVLLATTVPGYANLCRLITRGPAPLGPRVRAVVHWREVCEHAEGLIALWGGERSLLVGEADPFFVAHELREAFGDRLYAMVARHRRAEEVRQRSTAAPARRALRIPRRRRRGALPQARERRDLQDVLTCMRHRVKLSEAGRLIAPTPSTR